MSKEEHHIDDVLVARYLSGEGNPAERKALEQWIEGSKENRTYFEQCKKLFALNYAGAEVVEEESLPRFDALAAWTKVEAQLDDIDVSLGETDLVLEEIDEELESIATSYPWLRIAAILVVGLAGVFVLFNLLDDKTATYQASSSSQEFYLPDSTHIVLDRAATLSYSTKDYNKNNREVELTGKAYFDVVRNEDLPFVISTLSGKIEVLGTAFVVEENNDSLYVIVERGRVRLNSVLNPGKPDFLILSKNEKGVLDLSSKGLDKSIVDNLNELYWANNKLTYRQKSLTFVFDELAGIFGKEFIYNPIEIENCRITAVFQDQTLEEIMKNMALSMDFEYSISNDKVEIISQGCESN